MGIIVNEVNYAQLNKNAKKAFDKKTAEAIVRNICRALSADQRWVMQSHSQISEIENRSKEKIPAVEFAPLKFGSEILLKRENGAIYRSFSSKEGVVKGWHRDVVISLDKEKIPNSKEISDFIFTEGNRIAKTNSPYLGKKKNL